MLVVLLIIFFLVGGAFAVLFFWRRATKVTERTFHGEDHAPAEFLEGEVLQVVSADTHEMEGNAVADQETAVTADEENDGLL